jgi:hypothetical protein
MELTTAAMATPAEESATESKTVPAPISPQMLMLIKIGAIGFLAIAGYFLFSGGLGAADPEAGNSELMQKIQTVIGMGPKAGGTRFIAPILGAVVVAGLVLSLLSAGGRDAQTAKIQSKKGKKPKASEKEGTIPEPEPEEECNLASYLLFKSLDEAAAKAEAAAQAAKADAEANTTPIGAA